MANLDLTQQTRAHVPAQKPQIGIAAFCRAKLSNTLTGKKLDTFISDIVSLTNQDPALLQCDQVSLLGAAIQAQSLNLSLNKSMGQAWIVPFKDNKNKRSMATFQIGYKGYIQLAIRSGQYRKLNVLAVKAGELVSWDPILEDIEIHLIDNYEEREKAETIGYYAMFEYTNGFRKALYWNRSKMEMHAKRYSKAYSNDIVYGKNNSFWSKDFDSMAIKTMLRQLISKWGIMSVEMQTAYTSDMHVINEDGTSSAVLDVDSSSEDGVVDVVDVEEVEREPDPRSGEQSEKQGRKKSVPKQHSPAIPEGSVECPANDNSLVKISVCNEKCSHRSDCPTWNPSTGAVPDGAADEF